MSYPIISADSHITEHPDTYVAHIDAAWKDKAPKMVDGGERGDVFVIDGMDTPIAMGLVAAAGKPPEELTMAGVKFAEYSAPRLVPLAAIRISGVRQSSRMYGTSSSTT